MKNYFQQNQVETVCLRLKGLMDPRAFPRLWRVVKRIRPDIIHTQLFGADCYGRLIGRWMGIPVVSTIQSSVYESPDPYLYSSKQEWVDRWITRRCVQKFVAVSGFVKGSLQKRFRIPDSRIVVIPNAVDPSPFEKVASHEVDRLRVTLEIPKESKILITVGKLNPPKGHRFVLKALRLLKGQIPDWYWLIIGDGVSRSSLEKETQESGLRENVRFLGVRRDVPELLALSDLFVFPSVSEGLPFVLLEAMAAGKPCVAFRMGPMPEVVEEGSTGLLAEPLSAESLAHNIKSLLDDPARSAAMGAAGRDRVQNYFHADQMAERLGELYRRIYQRRWPA